ncbi:MAG TPA: hypothetical protein VEA36_03220 [Candidatus Paceibacterota bacterium]|nr:hypothetical protein [Candidatus Paceibacterota bacterium]
MTLLSAPEVYRIAKIAAVIVVVLFSILIAAPSVAQAQSTCPEGTSTALGTCRCEYSTYGSRDGKLTTSCRATTSTGEATGDTTTTVTSGLGTGGVTGAQVTDTLNSAGVGTRSVTQPKPEPKSCSITGGTFDIGECVAKALGLFMGWIVGGLALALLTLASFILWIVGGLFNWVVIKTIFEFGSTFGTSEGMLIAWGILRDIGNILLLFAFIFMGLATILNTHALDEYSARKALPRLIIFAVLLNFSLFAAQIVIDVSNSFAAVFTAQAGLSGCTTANDTVDVRTGLTPREACANNGIAGQVIQMAGISSIFSVQGAKDFALNSDRAAPVYIGLIIFVTITAVVLLAGAIMLVIRAVMLCLLMVLSPIGFAGMAVPPLQEFANRWWKLLLSNAFFAPIYLLMVLISLKIVEGLAGTNSNRSFAVALVEGSTNAPQIFVIFAVVIGFMVMALVVAKNMGAMGADFATRTAGGAVLGTYGFVARRTAGRYAGKAAEAIRSSPWGQKDRRIFGIPGTSARNISGLLEKTSKSNLSVRGVATTLGKGAHLDFGKPSKAVAHGIHGIEEQAEKDRVEYEKKLKATGEQKANAKEVEKERDAVKQELEDRRAKEFAELEAARLKVAQARLGTDKAALEQARKEFNEALDRYHKRNNDKEGLDLKDRLKKLEARLKYWNDWADQQKTDTYLNVGLENNWYPWFSVGTHADHEAKKTIKKNRGKSKIDKALDDFKKSVKDDKDGGEADADADAPKDAGAKPDDTH